MRLGGDFISKISEFGGSFDAIFGCLFSTLDPVKWSKNIYTYHIDLNWLFLFSLLFRVLVCVVSDIAVITILGYCPLMS
jgi:hypothetical protein